MEPAHDSTPEKIGGFRVIRRLATGGTSDVLLARAEGPHGFERVVVLKLLLAQFRDDASFERMFAREAAAYARLSHPAIVKLYDFFSEAGQLVMALEYVDGDTLETVVSRHLARARLAGAGALPGMPFRRSWYYFQQLLGALAAVHALGIVHRDVKPSNVLVRQDGIVKLTDFGIAKTLTPPAGTVQIRQLGSVPPPQDPGDLAPGTSLYMSPEQIESRPLDGRSDLYSAAVVLYEMLSGKTPFPGERSDFLIRQDHVEKPPPPIRTWLTQAPPVLDALFARALAKDPAMRFATAIEMGNAFRVGLGLPDSPEWRAQSDIAQEASALGVATTVQQGPPSMPPSRAANEKRLATLREFVVRGYRTARMASM